MKLLKYYIIISFLSITTCLFSQAVPSNDEKFPFLMTFSKNADKKWGDDDFSQTIFFVVPVENKNPVFINVFDPDNGDQLDENRDGFNSKTKFSVYGGKGAHSNKDAKDINPSGEYKSGTMLATKIFSSDKSFDNAWYTFGPFNPSEGELQPELGGYVFKLVVDGLDGDDGNLYKLFFSKTAETNIPVEGGNSFYYEYSVRLSDKNGSISHVYPFLPSNLIKIKINIFDYDDEGLIRTVTVAKKGEISNSKSEGVWSTNELKIVNEELKTSMDVQFIKKKEVKNNNMVLYILNQFNEAIPFFSVPIGGVPKYKYKIDISKTQ